MDRYTDTLQAAGVLAMGSRLKRLSDRLMQDGQHIYRDSQVSFEPRWFPVYEHLRRGPASITDIGRSIGVSHVAVNQIVSAMMQAGLVAAYRDTNDKRRRVVALTSRGKQKHQELETTWSLIEKALQTVVTDSGFDVVAVLAALDKVLDEKSFYDRFKMLEQREQASEEITIVRFRPELANDFARLNEEWITRLFGMEEADRRALQNPEGYIIDGGGEIVFAVTSSGKVLGTCALVKVDDAMCELAKMAVSPAAQGRGLGRLLGDAVIEVGREMGFMKMFLETNASLAPALALYASLGFEHKPFPYESEYSRADVYMELML